MPKLSIINIDTSTTIKLPLFLGLKAGFPSPAEDYIEAQLDLNKHLIKHPSATFFVRVSGDSMVDVGIFHNDILIVDRALRPQDRSIVVAALDGELTVKRLIKKENKLYLQPENPEYAAIEIKENSEFSVWGVVTNVIHTPL